MCYICKRNETEVREFLLPNLDNITDRYNSEIVNLEFKLQNKGGEDSPKLEHLIEEREIHLKSLERQKKAIGDLKHHEIFREIQSSAEFLEYRVKIHDGWGEDTSGQNSHDEISKTPFSVHICAICGTLAWWESGNVSLRFYYNGIIRLKQIEEAVSINPHPTIPVF